MTQLLPPEGLREEIREVYENFGERPPVELLAALNSPARIQRRGYPVTALNLLSIIIDIDIARESNY